MWSFAFTPTTTSPSPGSTCSRARRWPGSAPRRLAVRQPIPSGHKVALRGDRGRPAGAPLRPGDRLCQPGHPARRARAHPQPGRGRIWTATPPLAPTSGRCATVPEGERRTFLGYRRADGRVGTRNYIAVISTVNCSAHVAREIAHHFTPERLAAFPQRRRRDRPDPLPAAAPSSTILLQRTLAGMAAPSQRRRLPAGRPGLRDEPGRRPGRALWPARRTPRLAHPGDGRHPPDDAGRHRRRRSAAAGCQRRAAHAPAHLGADAGPAVRRQRRLVGRDRQPGGRPGRRRGGAAGRRPSCWPRRPRSMAPSTC